jgi:sugar lactone lactonase YvrE
VWLDLSDTESTPDGGALDEEGNVWLAVWGDASVHKYSQEGKLLDKVELRALQPTSCAFGGEHMDEMLITTAAEGMTEEQLEQYPDSGKVLLKKMDVKGRVLPVFNLEV